ncbi:MAG: lipoyl(octanoyl) transferase LipB [Planctomycetota bacterium]|nr:lipoyl(octanoyl) transferase LipB [Planctomycetota bacterium]
MAQRREIIVTDLGQMPYRQAWALQEETHARVVAGEPETLLIVEHPSVITLGRRPESVRNLLASVKELTKAGIELVHSDRGGDITYHGPGQIVAYPIIRLADHNLSVSGYVHRLEAIVIAHLAELGIKAAADPQAVGIWVDDKGAQSKICAIGVRVKKGATLHGLALNVTTDLAGFKNIIPCGLNGRTVTSIAKILGPHAPITEDVKKSLIQNLTTAFASPKSN